MRRSSLLDRTEKTIVLAVSPALKSFGIPGRPRLFEVVQKVRNINSERLRKAPGRTLTGESYLLPDLQKDPSLAVSYIVAPPRMAYYMVLDLVEKRLVTDQVVLMVGYDVENLTNPAIRSGYHGEVTTDCYGRRLPKQAHGTENLPSSTSSAKQIVEAVMRLFDRIVAPQLLVRRLNITVGRVIDEESVKNEPVPAVQLSIFDDPEELERRQRKETEERMRERKMQEAMLEIKRRFGKNVILKGMNLEEGVTARERNARIGGHKA